MAIRTKKPVVKKKAEEVKSASEPTSVSDSQILVEAEEKPVTLYEKPELPAVVNEAPVSSVRPSGLVVDDRVLPDSGLPT